jgi:RNA polymerase sigma-70 factor (ECF subfamily)
MQNYDLYEDKELAELLRAGDKLAFKELYIRYWDLLLDIAYKRLDSIDNAEELVQDLFVDLFLKREKLNITSSLEGYLKTALKYKIFNTFRSQYIHNRYVDRILNEKGVIGLSPEHEMQNKELSQKLDRATQKMPDKCREVFLLSRMEQFSNKSIAEKLNISVSTVEKHISKAIKILKIDFKEYNFELIVALYCLFRH